MFILSATTHSAALLAALSTSAGRGHSSRIEVWGIEENRGAEPNREEKTRNSFRIVCPLKVNITLQSCCNLYSSCNDCGLRTANCDSSCSCNCHCDFRFHCASAAALEGTFWQRQSTIFIASCTWQARATICLCPPFLQSLLIYVGRERGRRGCAGSAHTFNSFLWPLTLTFMALGARWEAFAYNSPIILTQCASKTLFRLDLDTSVQRRRHQRMTALAKARKRREQKRERERGRGSRAGTLLIRRVLPCTVRKVNNDKAL